MRGERIPPPPSRWGRHASPTDLIGRGPETARIDALLREAREGRSGTLVLRGPAGIGKTALMEYAAARAHEHGMEACRARGIEAESEVPFAGLSDLLAPVIDLRLELQPLHRTVLGVALGLEAGSPPPPFSVAAALLALVGAAAGDPPPGMLVLIDDAHWIDAGSLEAILFAARRLEAEGVAVLIAARPDPDRGLADRGLERLDLEGLADADALALVEAAGSGRAHRDPGDIVDLSAGYPLCLIELARVPYHASEHPPIRGDARPTEAIEAAFRQELVALDEEARRALVVVAADGRLSRAQILGAMAVLGVAPEALDRAELAGVFAPDCDEPVFRHPLLRHVVYYGATARWRARVHGVLADHNDGFRRAWHLGQSTLGPDAEAAEALEHAGRGAAARGDLSTAAHAYIRAVTLTPESDSIARRALAAAENSMLIGALPQSRDIAERALSAPIEDPGVRADLERIRGTVLGRMGQLQEGLHPLLEQADRVAEADPARAVVLLLGSGPVMWFTGDYARFQALIDRATELARPDHPELMAMAGLLGSLIQVSTGDLAGAERAIERSSWVLERPGLPDPGYELLGTPAIVSVWTERLDRAGALVDRQLARSRREGAVAELVFALTVRGLIALRSGRASIALAAGSEAVSLGADTGQRLLEGLALATLAQTEAVLGREEACRDHVAAAIRVADETGAVHLELIAQAAQATLELGLGRVDAALAASGRCERIAARAGLHEPNVARWHGDRVEALVRAGDIRGAVAVADALEDRLATSPTAWAEATVARARDLLTPSDASALRLTHAIEALERAGDVFEAARLRFGLGERLRRSKQRKAAREPLAAALDVFTRAGAEPWAARAAEELRSAGGASTTATAPGLEELTAHELRIALLVAEGRTNPEVAAELFVSRKTVEFHLSHVYRKLGLRSRTELAGVLNA